jgi:hypothetical protein
MVLFPYYLNELDIKIQKYFKVVLTSLAKLVPL